MPTGYTSFIEDGNITTGKDFVMLCTRNFGVAMDVKDEPLSVPTPMKFKPKEYYWNSYIDAVKELEEFKTKSFEEIKQDLIRSDKETLNNYKKNIEKDLTKNAMYDKIQHEIEEWDAPAEHDSLKEFALDQIRMSRYDSLIEHYKEEIRELENSTYTDDDIRTYINGETNRLKQCVQRRYDFYLDEDERCARKEKYMKDLVESWCDKNEDNS